MFQRGLLICMLALSVPPAFGVEGPAPELLRTQFEQNLPNGWELTAFNIEASENYGTAVEPEFKHRFNAPIELVGDTFVEAAKEGSVTLLTRVGRVGEQRIVYGISTAVREAGSWAVTFEFENDPTAGMGKSRDFFSGRLIVKGSKDEATYLRQQQRDAEVQHEAQLALIARQAEIEEAERQAVREAELAQLAHEAQMRGKERQITARELAKLEASKQAMGKDLVDDIKDHVALEMPGYWKLVNFTIEQAAHSGSYQEPVFEHDFEAKVQLEKDTYAIAEREGYAALVRPIAKAGVTKTVYGKSRTSTSSEDGGWDVELSLQGVEGLHVGQPLDLFPGRNVILGSKQEKVYREELEATAEENKQMKLAALKRKEELEAAERAQREGQVTALNEAFDSGEREEMLAALSWAFESGEPGLMARALSLAFTKKDKEVQVAAIGAALASNELFLKRKAIISAERTEDVDVNSAAVLTALESEDAATKQLGVIAALGTRVSGTAKGLAIATVLSQAASLTIYPGCEGCGSIEFRITEFDAQSGKLTGHFVGAQISSRAQEEKAVGQLNGTSLGIATSEISVNVILGKEGRMTGSFASYESAYGNTYEVTSQATVLLAG